MPKSYDSSGCFSQNNNITCDFHPHNKYSFDLEELFDGILVDIFANISIYSTKMSLVILLSKQFFDIKCFIISLVCLILISASLPSNAVSSSIASSNAQIKAFLLFINNFIIYNNIYFILFVKIVYMGVMG